MRDSRKIAWHFSSELGVYALVLILALLLLLLTLHTTWALDGYAQALSGLGCSPGITKALPHS